MFFVTLPFYVAHLLLMEVVVTKEVEIFFWKPLIRVYKTCFIAIVAAMKVEN
jgi:hypothetical protein